MADKLGMTEIKGEGWRPWLVEDVPAGYVTVYDNPTGPANFTFITVKDAGHMVVRYTPILMLLPLLLLPPPPRRHCQCRRRRRRRRRRRWWWWRRNHT